MKTKILNLFLLLVASIETMFAWDYKRVQIGDLYYNLDATNQTAEVTNKSYSNYTYNEGWNVTNANIPASVAYHSVTYSVTSIGWGAFYDCRSLTSVTIPNSVTSIGDYAFSRCSGLTKVNIMDIAAWCNIAFSNYESNPLSYAKHLYVNDVDVTDLVIPNSVTSIGDFAFYNCSGLTSVTIPNSVTNIGNHAFYECTGLTKVNITDIAAWCNIAFSSSYSNPLYYANHLYLNDVEVTDLVIPNSITSIGSYAFYKCNSLTSVTIPNSVTSIGYSAFAYCRGLTSVTIPNSVTSIGDYAFSGCSSLTSVTIPNNVATIGSNAFNNVLNIVYNGTVSGSPWGAKYVNGYADGWLLYSDSTKTTILLCSMAATGELIIPASVATISNNAFYGCSGLNSVTIGNNVKRIGGSAFYYCSQLASVTIGDSVNYIGDDAFSNCRNLTSVSIPNSTNWIGNNVFYECTQLQIVSLGDNITNIGNCAFQNCRNLTSISLPNSVTYLGGAVFAGCVNLESVHLSSNISDIYRETFSGCKKLASINLPSGIASIGDGAFTDCSSLTSVTIPNSVTSIGVYAFSGCSALISAEIGNGVNKIGYDAFKGCSNLQTLTLGENITTYGSSAFSACSALTSIYNYRKTPVALSADVFKNVDYFACTLYVLEGSVDMYNSDRSSWKDFFYNIEPISATSTTTGNDIQVTPTDNTANIVWPKVNGAETYELVIKDKPGNVISTLIFNANGQLTSIAFNAPSRNNALHQTQAAGFAFTVTGLNSGTNYDLVMTSKNSNGATIQTKTVSFTTTGNAQSVENILGGNAQSTKIFRNGQIYILRGEKTYTLQGQEVK